MKRLSRGWRRVLLALAAVMVLVAAFRLWGVRAIIAGQLHARYGGRVTFAGWHVDESSSNLRDLVLGETSSPDSPVWAEVERVETDLTLGGIARGHIAPTRIILVHPRITFRLGPDGDVLTRPPLKSQGDPSAVPSVTVQSGRVTIEQEGRPKMVVEPIRATLSPGDGGEILHAETDSDFWGKWTATGKFASGFGSGTIALQSDEPVNVDAEKTARLPFVPEAVWEHIRPRGPVKVGIVVKTGDAPSVVTRGEYLGATLDLPTLGLIAEGVTGRMTIDGAKVTIEGATGRALGGEIGARGTLDFGVVPSRFDLVLDLKNVDVARTPKSWQLAEAGITGRLTGSAHLRVALTNQGASLSGSEGSGVVEDAVLSGVAVKSLKLAMKAEGGDLQYETAEGKGATVPPPLPAGGEAGRRPGEGAARPLGLDRSLSVAPPPHPAAEAATLSRKGRGRMSTPLPAGGEAGRRPGEGAARPLAHDRSPSVAPPPHPADKSATLSREGRGRDIHPALLVVALQAPPAQDKPPPPKPGGFVLPKTLSTEVEFEDADLVQIITKARALGIPLPFAVSGKFSLKAKATIPLGTLRDVRGYAFHGRATLKGASIAGVDLGAASAQVDLERGVLDLTDLRGQLVDRPDGSPANPPPITDLAPREGPLPPGAFRGELHAVISPPGKITAHLEGDALPIGEVAAPVLPSPPPVSGSVLVALDVTADAAHLDDPKTWTVAGRIDAASVRYRDTVLDRLKTTVRLSNGKVALPDLVASLEGRPLKARLAIDAVAPYAFDGLVDATGWDLDDMLAFVPAMPRPAPVGGRLTVRLAAKGTLDPQKLAIDGDGMVRDFRAGPVALGDVPIRWRTEGAVIRVTVADARPLGGVFAAEAAIPTDGGRPIRGTATFRDLDVAAASALIPGSAATITGRASGRGTFVVRPIPVAGEAAVEGTLNLTAPDLTVQGVPAKSLKLAMTVSHGTLRYEARGETLGGTVDFTGDLPVTASRPGDPAPEANGSLQAIGFRLEGLWKPLGLGGAVSKIEGLAAIDANLRTHLSKPDVRARGIAEVRELRWGPDYPIGLVKGSVTVTPAGWRVDPLSGEILGGTVRGSVVAEQPAIGPQNLRFDLEVGDASLKKVVAFLPELAARIDGRGTLRVAGRAADAIRVDGELFVPTGKLLGIPVSELRAPADLEYAPNGGRGVLRVRHWTARFAGGRLTGDARFGLGGDHSFGLDTQLQALDIESTLRLLSDVRRPASGKVSGKISVSGTDPAHPERYRGRIDLDLDDASLVELPVFRQLDRFLGAARGGVFEDGEVHATIGNRQIHVDALTLTGRLVQLHAAGTVGFDGRLDLAVLVNTNQVISQTGQALARLIPGGNDASGRRLAASGRFASFLSNRLLKFRVGGTLSLPTVDLDPALAVGEGAVGFFAGVLKLPLELLR